MDMKASSCLKAAWQLALPFAITFTAMTSRAAEPKSGPMPHELETRYALSALPPALRTDATVYLLDPASGYVMSKRGTNGIQCIVERTAWELADFRDDIFIPLCYDAAGASTYLKVIMDAAALRIRGLSPTALKSEVERRYKSGTYKPPEKSGLSYMISPVMRTVGPPDMKVRTMAMPHFMFYAANVSNQDIGARPRLDDMSSLQYPFIDRQGNGEQSYMIQLVGEAEKAKIMSTEKPLEDALCKFAHALCLTNDMNQMHS